MSTLSYDTLDDIEATVRRALDKIPGEAWPLGGSGGPISTESVELHGLLVKIGSDWQYTSVATFHVEDGDLILVSIE